MEAYEDCFNDISTAWAPWYVVPAHQKPSGRLLVALLIYHSLAAVKMEYPTVSKERRADLMNIRQLLERAENLGAYAWRPAA